MRLKKKDGLNQMSRLCKFYRLEIAIKGEFFGEEPFNNQFISETVGWNSDFTDSLL